MRLGNPATVGPCVVWCRVMFCHAGSVGVSAPSLAEWPSAPTIPAITRRIAFTRTFSCFRQHEMCLKRDRPSDGAGRVVL